MQFSASNPRVRARTQRLSRAVGAWFPTPELLAPRTFGVDISDASIKWLALEPHADAHRVAAWGLEPLQEGIVEQGLVRDHHALATVLHEIAAHLGGISHAHVALPEEAAYVFDMRVPSTISRDEVLHMIEFEFEGRVPIPVSSAVYDFDVISSQGGNMHIAVVVFPRELAESYVAAFEEAGLTLLSLELKARSIARAVMASGDDSIVLLVDFGRERTGLAVAQHGVPIFTSTVEVGGDSITRSLVKSLSLSPEAAERFRNEKGLLARGAEDSAGLAAVTSVASALADEVARHYRYWDTRRDEHGERMTPVSRVILVGGSSNLRGIEDFLAARIQAPVVRGDIWQNICRFDDYIPPIERSISLQFAIAAGLALRSLPRIHL